MSLRSLGTIAIAGALSLSAAPNEGLKEQQEKNENRPAPVLIQKDVQRKLEEVLYASVLTITKVREVQFRDKTKGLGVEVQLSPNTFPGKKMLPGKLMLHAWIRNDETRAKFKIVQLRLSKETPKGRVICEFQPPLLQGWEGLGLLDDLDKDSTYALEIFLHPVGKVDTAAARTNFERGEDGMMILVTTRKGALEKK